MITRLKKGKGKERRLRKSTRCAAYDTIHESLTWSEKLSVISLI